VKYEKARSPIVKKAKLEPKVWIWTNETIPGKALKAFIEEKYPSAIVEIRENIDVILQQFESEI
jgi:hypothetical protein